MQEKLLQRFLRYVAVPSQSNAANANVPSSEGQRKLAELLKQDLAELGLVDLEISRYSVLTGKLPAYLPEGCTKEVPAVGWCAHLDTIDINMSPEIHPQVVKNYQGGDVCLNKEKDIWIRTAEHPELENTWARILYLLTAPACLAQITKPPLPILWLLWKPLLTKNAVTAIFTLLLFRMKKLACAALKNGFQQIPC